MYYNLKKLDHRIEWKTITTMKKISNKMLSLVNISTCKKYKL